MADKNILERIKEFPRRNYIRQTTELRKLPGLSRALGGRVDIYIKRDDQLPFGGNKARKLELLFQEAVDLGADTIITASTVQCNHNLMALLMANIEGMKTELILESWASPDYDFASDPNKHLYEFAGVSGTITSSSPVTGPLHTMDLALAKKADLEARGKKPYILARGGTGPLGNCGYILCADEIIGQGKQMGVDFDYVVCPSGTGGTQAGLILGFDQANYPTTVIGINVAQKNDRQIQAVANAIRGTASFLSIEACHDDRIICYEEYVGEGYSRSTPLLEEAIRLLAQTEGIMVDPVYSGKALAGLIGLIRSGVIESGSRVAFLHTGGFLPYYDYSTMWRRS